MENLKLQRLKSTLALLITCSPYTAIADCGDQQVSLGSLTPQTVISCGTSEIFDLQVQQAFAGSDSVILAPFTSDAFAGVTLLSASEATPVLSLDALNTDSALLALAYSVRTVNGKRFAAGVVSGIGDSAPGELATASAVFDDATQKISTSISGITSINLSGQAETQTSEVFATSVEEVRVALSLSASSFVPGLESAEVKEVSVRLLFEDQLLIGDYDINGVVDDRDYEIWRANYGADSTTGVLDPTPPGDGNGDRVTDGADFLIWQRNYGNTSPSDVITSLVPEPSSLAIGCVATLMCCSRSHNRQH